MFYQDTKTARAAAIGTIMPWTGALSKIPKGWVLCDGQTLTANEFPLLVQAIGDTYNAGVSTLGGNFPTYTGSIVLPNLNGKALMDLEEDYFATALAGGTGKSIDTDADARTNISPFIGDNGDIGLTTIFNDVYTDVIFTLNDRTGYTGKITGNTIVPGDASKTVYIGPRKLGRNHLRSHNHSGSYETVNRQPSTEPGDGVIPYSDIQFTMIFRVVDNISGGSGDYYYAGPTDDESFDGEPGVTTGPGMVLRERDWATIENRTGFGSGQPGRTVARIASEAPPVNLYPRYVISTPLGADLLQPALSGGSVVPHGLGDGNITIPAGYRNFYPDVGAVGNFRTLTSNPAQDFLDNSLPIFAHTHDEVEINFATSNLKPQSTLNASVNIPANTNLDNLQNRGALQVNFNTSQPSLSCLYIIRAY